MNPDLASFTALKLLFQLEDTPLILTSLNGRRVLALNAMEKFGLVEFKEGRAFVTEKGTSLITHLGMKMRTWIEENDE